MTDLHPFDRSLPLTTVEGSIHIEAAAQSNIIGAGTLSGGCQGVRYSLVYLREAIDAAIARLYPLADPESPGGPCPADLQIVHPNFGICGPTAPMLLIVGPRDDSMERPCVAVAGIIPDLDNPRTVRDAVEARGASE